MSTCSNENNIIYLFIIIHEKKTHTQLHHIENN